MHPVYVFHRDVEANCWTVSRVVRGTPEALFRCSTAPEARALTQALRAAAAGDAGAKCDALRSLGLSRTANGTATVAA